MSRYSRSAGIGALQQTGGAQYGVGWGLIVVSSPHRNRLALLWIMFQVNPVPGFATLCRFDAGSGEADRLDWELDPFSRVVLGGGASVESNAARGRADRIEVEKEDGVYTFSVNGGEVATARARGRGGDHVGFGIAYQHEAALEFATEPYFEAGFDDLEVRRL